VLRVNLPPAATAADAVALLRRVREETGIEHAFVDLMYLGADCGTALDLVGEILDAAGS
jgi:hypothetical protein